jgi:hypothetical protein
MEKENLQLQVGPSPAIGGRKGAKMISEAVHTASAATKLMIDSNDGHGLGYGQSEFMTLDENIATDRESR